MCKVQGLKTRYFLAFLAIVLLLSHTDTHLQAMVSTALNVYEPHRARPLLLTRSMMSCRGAWLRRRAWWWWCAL
jgi:hypothetical protein